MVKLKEELAGIDTEWISDRRDDRHYPKESQVCGMIRFIPIDLLYK